MNTYSVLILDDEEFSVDVLMEDIHWEKCGISQVHGVYSVRQAKEFLKKNLKALIHYIFRPENLLIDYTGTEEGLAGIEEKIAEFRSTLFTDEVSGTPYVPELSKKNEAFMTAGQVQYVCRAGNFLKKGLPFTGALKVLKVMMGYEYLWTQVRG